MAERNKSCRSKKTTKRSRSWTEIELKYFALILADKENRFAYKLDTLAIHYLQRSLKQRIPLHQKSL